MDIGFGQSSKWKVVCLAKMHHISKNWELVFDFQYKVVTGQCGDGIPVMSEWLSS